MNIENKDLSLTNAENDSTLNDDWVKISHDDHELKSEFHPYNLMQTSYVENEEWINLDNTLAVQAEQKYLKKYAYGEYLGHHLAYQLSKKENSFINCEKTCDVLEEDGSYKKYNFIKLKTDNSGLVGYILIPKQVESGKVPDIKVIFRGTQCFASMLRDLELSGGAGAISFARNKNAILEQINNAIQDFNLKKEVKHVNVTLAGHSLGGADAQNCMIIIMDAISQNHGLKVNEPDQIIPASTRVHMNCIKDLRLFNYNSAGIPKKSEQKSIELAKFLYTQRAASKTQINLQTYNLLVVGDGIQQTGESHILSNVSAECATVDVLKANIGYGYRNISSLNNNIAANVVLGILPTGIPKYIVTNSIIAGKRTILNCYNTYCAHTTQLLIEPNNAQVIKNQVIDYDKKTIKPISYERLTNENYLGQEKVAKSLNKKCQVLNVCQKIVNNSINYGYDNLKRIGNFLSINNSINYGYDNLKRIGNFFGINNSINYGYDNLKRIGNFFGIHGSQL